jgi:hypothetical protein
MNSYQRIMNARQAAMRTAIRAASAWVLAFIAVVIATCLRSCNPLIAHGGSTQRVSKPTNLGMGVLEIDIEGDDTHQPAVCYLSGNGISCIRKGL